MKIIFDTEEQMQHFIQRIVNNDATTKGCIIDVSDEECDSYENCVDCFKDHVDVTYVKSCNECVKTNTCTNAYYRGDLVNRMIKCEPKAR